MSTETLHITIPTELANHIRDRVRSGEYASESDVVINRFTQELDPTETLSLAELNEAVEILQNMELHPEATFTIKDLQADLDQQHHRRLHTQ